MDSHPPAFRSQIQEQKKWDEGFIAGVKEIFHEMEATLDAEDPAGPTRKWVEEVSAKLINKYS